MLLAKQDFAAAETELRAAADGLERTNPDGGQAGLTRAYLCAMLRGQDKLADARAACAASIASLTRVLGAESPGLVWPLTLSGQVETATGAPTTALPFLHRAVALGTTNHVRPIEVAIAKAQLAIALQAAGHTVEAKALATEVAPMLAAPELAETRADFVRAFPALAG